MKNLKNIDFKDYNIMVYLKTKLSGKFEAVQSLKTFTIAPNLMYAALFPYEKLERVKEFINQYETACKQYNYTLQIRSSIDRKKVLHQIN